MATSDDFRQIQPFTQQVNPDNDIKDTHPQITQDFHSFQCFHFGMEILRLE